MEELIQSFLSGIKQFTWLDAVDILLVTYLIYKVLVFARQTRAMQAFKGLGLILVLSLLCNAVNLVAISWILNTLISAGVIVLLILFQPELRRLLEQFGQRNILESTRFSRDSATSTDRRAYDELLRALLNQSKRRVGVLIVMERKTQLSDVIATGTAFQSEVRAELLESIFYPGTPLHDGAVIIRDGHIIAAGCFLPLAVNTGNLNKQLGTRHRAAVGITQQSDSFTFVVSEENGVISLARDGKLQRDLDAVSIRNALDELTAGSSDPAETKRKWYTRKKNVPPNDDSQVR